LHPIFARNKLGAKKKERGTHVLIRVTARERFWAMKMICISAARLPTKTAETGEILVLQHRG
jgi:hypothetical protein